MANRNIIEINGISKTFGRRRILDHISLKVHRGSITSIVGENGSGKTTLLKIIVGMLKPGAGSTHISGTFGYCPQESQIFPRLTLRENLLYFATAYGLKRKNAEWKKDMERLLTYFQFHSHLDIAAGKLSGGTRQKLNLIIALLHNPDLLILDEPYAAFDWESYQNFWILVEKLKKEGKSFLIVSHLIYEKSQIDRVIELKNGRLV
jgi:ABC-type multidrug transport system ATPase subunit